MLSRKMHVKYSLELLQRLCAIWPNPDTGKPGLNASELAAEVGFKTRQTGYDLLGGKKPSDDSLLLLGKYFGLYFTHYWDDTAPSVDAIIATKQAFLDKYVYKKKASA